MTTKHKMRATIPLGDPDDTEIEVEITFNHTRGRPAVMYLRNGDPGYPADPAEIEFISATPDCFSGLAQVWFETIGGQDSAFETVADDDDAAREYAAELRADR